MPIGMDLTVFVKVDISWKMVAANLLIILFRIVQTIVISMEFPVPAVKAIINSDLEFVEPVQLAPIGMVSSVVISNSAMMVL